MSELILSDDYIFYTVEGEGRYAGWPSVFMRLSMCNLTCQGFKTDIPTPFIDSIATNGIRFTNAYVSAPYCSPSRAGLLTGRYATRSKTKNPLRQRRRGSGIWNLVGESGQALRTPRVGEHMHMGIHMAMAMGMPAQGAPLRMEVWSAFIVRTGKPTSAGRSRQIRVRRTG